MSKTGKYILIFAIAAIVVFIALYFVLPLSNTGSGSVNGDGNGDGSGNEEREKEEVFITPPVSPITQDGKEWVFIATETFTSHPTNTSEALYIYVSQSRIMNTEGTGMRNIYVYHVYRATDSENAPPVTSPAPGQTTIIIDDSWEYLETITTNSHTSNTHERIYVITDMQYVLVDKDDASKGMQWLYIFDVYVNANP